VKAGSVIDWSSKNSLGSEAVQSTISDLGSRQANPLAPLNLISDQALITGETN